MAWTTTAEPEEREIRDPASGETAKVYMRPLSWGDLQKLNELKLRQQLDGGSEVALSPGENKVLMVDMAVVRWTLPFPKTRETIQALPPPVGEQLFALVDVGRGPDLEGARRVGWPDEPRVTGNEEGEGAVPPMQPQPEAAAVGS